MARAVIASHEDRRGETLYLGAASRVVSKERQAAEVLRDALALPAEARAELIDSWIDSLDGEIDDDAEAAWKDEIDRRLQQIDSGAVDLIPWEVARRRLHGRLGR